MLKFHSHDNIILVVLSWSHSYFCMQSRIIHYCQWWQCKNIYQSWKYDYFALLETRIQGYKFWPARKILPPPLNFFPVFVDFFAVFKLHSVFYHSFLFSSFPPFSFPFFKSFKFFPVFHFGQKSPPGGGGWPEYISLQGHFFNISHILINFEKEIMSISCPHFQMRFV